MRLQNPCTNILYVAVDDKITHDRTNWWHGHAESGHITRSHSANMPTDSLSSYDTYKEAANTMSLLMHCEVASILRYRDGLPTTRAALRKSAQSSSRRVMVRTTLPSCVSVILAMLMKDRPRAHSYTTAARPKLTPVLPGPLSRSFTPNPSCSKRNLACRSFT